MESAAVRVARDAIGTAPAWVGQIGAYDGAPRSAAAAPELAVAYVALVPLGADAPPAPPAGRGSVGRSAEWIPLTGIPALAPPQERMIEGALTAVRDRLDVAPVAFRLLPTTFTLSELQQIYELLLGRRLHKASFRRALQAAALVEATDEWRSEGRGRPAQLYRYAPRRRRRGRRGVRFDLVGM